MGLSAGAVFDARGIRPGPPRSRASTGHLMTLYGRGKPSPRGDADVIRNTGPRDRDIFAPVRRELITFAWIGSVGRRFFRSRRHTRRSSGRLSEPPLCRAPPKIANDAASRKPCSAYTRPALIFPLFTAFRLSALRVSRGPAHEFTVLCA